EPGCLKTRRHHPRVELEGSTKVRVGLRSTRPIFAGQEERYAEIVVRLDAPVGEGKGGPEGRDSVIRASHVKERHGQTAVCGRVGGETMRQSREQRHPISPDAGLAEGRGAENRE